MPAGRARTFGRRAHHAAEASIDEHRATATTPLLGIERHHQKKADVPRIPTVIQGSIPTKRSITRIFLSITLDLVIEVFLPVILYYILKPSFSAIWALVISGIPPLLVVLYKGIRDRKLDAMGLLMLAGFVFSAAIATVQADPKLYLMRESLITIGMGLVFLVTLVPITFKGRTLHPFLFYTARQFAIATAVTTDEDVVEQHWQWLWDNRPRFRRLFRLLTCVWGVAFVLEFFSRLVMIYTLDIDKVIYYSNLLLVLILVTIGGFTAGYSYWIRRKSDKEIAARRTERLRAHEAAQSYIQ